MECTVLSTEENPKTVVPKSGNRDSGGSSPHGSAKRKLGEPLRCRYTSQSPILRSAERKYRRIERLQLPTTNSEVSK